jgi:hypothetical protein
MQSVAPAHSSAPHFFAPYFPLVFTTRLPSSLLFASGKLDRGYLPHCERGYIARFFPVAFGFSCSNSSSASLVSRTLPCSSGSALSQSLRNLR